jgi:hypothetical protein
MYKRRIHFIAASDFEPVGQFQDAVRRTFDLIVLRFCRDLIVKAAVWRIAISGPSSAE